MTRNVLALLLIGVAFCETAGAQGRPLDWSFYGGDPQRTGWEKSDIRITKDNVKDFQLVIKRKLDGSGSLTPPVVIGLLISYRGFKELGFVAGSSGLWSIDVDTDRIFWQKRFDIEPGAAACAGMAMATPSLTPAVNFAARPRPAPGAPRTPPSADAARSVLGATGFGSPRPVFALSSDGKLHFLNTSTGDEVAPPIPFIPAGARGSSLVISDGTIYTTTVAGCGNAPAGVWAMDLRTFDPKNRETIPQAVSYRTNSGSDLAFGTDGTVYVQTGEGLAALSPRDLKLKESFTLHGPNENMAAPVVFARNGRDLVVTAGPDGALYMLDSQSLTAPLYQTRTGTVRGGLSSWQDADGTRWVLAPVWGPLDPALHLGAGGAHGSIVAFKVEDANGKPVLTPAWASQDMRSPQPPVIASGIVFALSSGDSASGAALYALDGATGKEMYSTGSQVRAQANLTGMTVANGRVYFTTVDNTLYAFGIPLER